MIMAYDEGAWHPSPVLSGLWLVLALASLVSQLLLARGGHRKAIYYVIIVLPVVGLFAFNAYLNYAASLPHVETDSGNYYVRSSAIARTATELLFGIPTLVAVVIAHLGRLRVRSPRLFWGLFGLVVLIECLSGSLFWIIKFASL